MLTLARAFANESGQKDLGLMQAPLLRVVPLFSTVGSLPYMCKAHVCGHVYARTHVSGDNLQELGLSFTYYGFWGINFRWLGLASSELTCWAIN